MSKTTAELIAPSDCTSLDDCCMLETDHHDLEGFWILTDGYRVSLVKQNVGESSTASIEIPKRTFDALAGWYFRKQKVTNHEIT